MARFLGEFSHSLDGKGRVILPAKFRELLPQAYVTAQKEGCLALWSPDKFAEKADVMETKFDGSVEERNVARLFFANAQEANPDRQGRVAISPNLRRFAALSDSVTLTGCGDHIEIWDTATWEAVSRAGERELKSGAPRPPAAVAAGSPGEE